MGSCFKQLDLKDRCGGQSKVFLKYLGTKSLVSYPASQLGVNPLTNLIKEGGRATGSKKTAFIAHWPVPPMNNLEQTVR